MEFKFSNKAKITTIVLMVVGLISIIAGFLTDHAPEGVNPDDYHHTRFWGNILVNSYFFFSIALGSLFFLGLQYATEASYAVTVKRIMEGIIGFLPIGSLLLILVFLMGTLHVHHLYHWMDPAVYNPESPEYDALIAGKAAYLNQPFFWVRTIAYLAGWYLFARWFRKTSLKQDTLADNKLHFKSMNMSGWFLVFFAITSSASSWDWIMSIDTHWFSTLFGWYAFSGMWVTAICTMILLILYLKSKGYLSVVNENHIHDLGKWMFAISVLWTYLWFSQFMLIWYSNIPEEVTYFITRLEHYKWFFLGTMLVNLLFPLVILMSRDAKRTPLYLLPVAIVVFFGHWADTYLMVVPGTQGSHWHFGWMEIGIFLGFLGLFSFVVFRTLTKAPLVVKNHPYLEESKHLHV